MQRSGHQAETRFPLAQLCPPQVTFRNMLPDESVMRLVFEADAKARQGLLTPHTPSSVVIERDGPDFHVEVRFPTRDGPCALRACAPSLERALASAYSQAPLYVRHPAKRKGRTSPTYAA